MPLEFEDMMIVAVEQGGTLEAVRNAMIETMDRMKKITVLFV